VIHGPGDKTPGFFTAAEDMGLFGRFVFPLLSLFPFLRRPPFLSFQKALLLSRTVESDRSESAGLAAFPSADSIPVPVSEVPRTICFLRGKVRKFRLSVLL
jgi:hypothetical protein